MYFKLAFFIVVIAICNCSHNEKQSAFVKHRLSEYVSYLSREVNNDAIPPLRSDISKDTLANVTQNLSEHMCPYIRCNLLNYPCISCTMNDTCIYGNETIAKCHAHHHCIGDEIFERPFICQYCYQTESWEHSCVQKANCDSVASPRSSYRTNCTVRENVLCLGRRTFLRKLPCNWTGGHRWTTAMLLSVTLGGFGADRFYLGYWQEGIGKLFSFGGLGVWTIIDFILITIQYLGPADGSLYI